MVTEPCVPFIFCYHPELLMIGSPFQIVFKSLLALLTMFCITSGFIGYLFKPLNFLQRLICVFAGIAFIEQSFPAIVAGIVSVLIVFIWQGFMPGRQVKRVINNRSSSLAE